MSNTTVHGGTTFTGRYLSVTSFRRDGTPVATPVWFVRDGVRLLVHTDADSYKVKRIRRNPSVRIAPCTARGRLRGQPVPATAVVLPDSELARVQQLMAVKYRVDMLFFRPLRAIQAALGRSRGKPVILAITPTKPTVDRTQRGAASIPHGLAGGPLRSRRPAGVSPRVPAGPGERGVWRSWSGGRPWQRRSCGGGTGRQA
jgi:PPOX class probable F420-dependent enzyme